ncbi:hypothetical protein R1sor_025099 [Riccia sorocarpa]|uniref:Reverse transcriptase domain-containing protein n=1 Tax=Riccia sorocarpa TaxID=122646 RepID=A0ABD3G947_9MARC
MRDTNYGYFLAKFKRRSAHGTMKSLRRDDGTVLISQNEITKEVYSFYEKLYRKPMDTADTVRDRDKMLRLLKPAFSRGEQVFLSEPPSFQEFSDILNSSPRGKTHGIDGFSYEAMKEVWEELGEDFTATMQTCWETGTFPGYMLEGIIKLIPKEVRPETIHGWRPIALLTVHYKEDFIKILEGLSNGASVRVQTNTTLTPEFPIDKGVRQECPLALLLIAISTIPFILAAQEGAAKGKIVTADFRGASSCISRPWLMTRLLFWGSMKLHLTSSFSYLRCFSPRPEPRSTSRSRKSFCWAGILNLWTGSRQGALRVLRFLVQTKLTFAISLVMLRKSHLKTLRQLFRSYLWGTSTTGRPKTPMVAWPQTFGHSGAGCAECGWAQEDLTHVFLCPNRRRFWRDLFWACPFLREVSEGFFQGFKLPGILSEASRCRGPDRLAFTVVLAHALRVCWRRRRDMQFNGRWEKPLLLLSAYLCCGDSSCGGEVYLCW